MLTKLLKKLPDILQAGYAKSSNTLLYVSGALLIKGSPETTETLLNIKRILQMSKITEGAENVTKAAKAVATKAVATKAVATKAVATKAVATKAVATKAKPEGAVKKAVATKAKPEGAVKKAVATKAKPEGAVKKAVATKAVATKAVATKAKPEGAAKKVTIGSFCIDLIVQGLTNDEILAKVTKAFPDASTSTSSLAWYRNKIKRGG